MPKYLLEMKNITKTFPGVKALDEVDIQIEEGEIHCICGENGAGKSTLINTICGVFPHDTYEGELIYDGKKQEFDGIKEAEEKGIICIHQELALVPEMSVGENIFLGNQPSNFGVVKWDQIYCKTTELLEQVGLGVKSGDEKKTNLVTPNDKINSLGIGQQQLVEIAKALSKDAKLLILDEPTAALTEQEIEILLDILRKLKEKGVTCIYISHKLDEVLEIADNITVLRDGKSINTKKKIDTDKDDLIKMMVGRELENLFPREEHHRGDIGLEIKNFSVDDPNIPGKKIIKDVSLKAYKGEILGISGLMGSGRTELFSSIYGTYSAQNQGEIFIEGEKVKIENAVDAIKNGISLVPEDRKNYGLVLGMNIKENSTLASLNLVSDGGIINSNEEIHQTRQYIEYLRTKTPSIEEKAQNLSGGNQQKVVLGKALMTNPKVLILDEPTRGIDVGAKYEIYNLMNKLVDEGVTIIMISSELEEILGMSDRVLVMCEGKLSGEFEIDDANQENIITCATGGM